MAARSVVISFHTHGGSSTPDLRIEPRWWDAATLCADPRFSMTNESRSYFDWSAYLTDGEFRALHEKFRPRATSGGYEAADRQRVIHPQLMVIDGALAGALGTITKAGVTVFEWESGLGD